MLDFFIDMITDDIRTSAASSFLYGSKRLRIDFPFVGRKKDVVKRTISSDGMTVIATPWNSSRLLGAIYHIKSAGFRNDIFPVRNGAWFPEVRLIVVDNGLHHSCVAAQRALPGLFEVDVYPLSEHFSDVSTDGQTWFIHDGKTRSYPVSDVRLALLFELARRRTKAAQATAAPEQPTPERQDR